MKIFRRLVALLLSLMVVGLFYVLSLMMENEESKRGNEFVVEAVVPPLSPMAPLDSADARQLSAAFGLAFPLPEGLSLGRVEDGSWHTYKTRILALEGSAARVLGIRPASAAAAIFPGGATFLAGQKALLGYPLLEAAVDGRQIYALVTEQAAFLIEPKLDGEPGAFSLMQPSP